MVEQATADHPDAFERQHLELEACKEELAKQAAEMEAAAEFASILAEKGHTIAAQSPGQSIKCTGKGQPNLTRE